MARYDIENFLTDLLSAMQDGSTGLNSYITAINSEKNDTLTVPSISNSAYFLQTMNESVAAYDPFILYGVTKIESEGIGPATSSRYTVQVVISFADKQDGTAAKRLFRYSRALEDLFHSKFDKISQNRVKKIISIEPVEWTLVNSSESFRAVGVDLEVVLTS
jgi:hypothetical protein